MPSIPDDPFSLLPSQPLNVTARAELQLFGAGAELICLPDRAARSGVPGTRPAFQPNRADEIIRREAVWEAPGVALTPNRFPFADRHAVLWCTERRWHPSLAMLEVGFAIEDATAGTTIVNSVGAAASIARSHIHLIGERLPYLSQLRKADLEADVVGLRKTDLDGCQLERLASPFPVLAVGVRGPHANRARVVHRLLECRTTPAFNLIGSEGTAWLVPRSEVEVPAPHFPQALGGAEFWGRWCFDDRDTLEKSTAQALEQAVRLTGVSP
jgi:hypothetical protein